MQTMHTELPIMNEAEELKYGLHNLLRLCTYLFLGVLLVSNLPSCMRSRLYCLSSRNVNVSRQMKASMLHGRQSAYETQLRNSSTSRSVFYYE